HAHGVTRDRGQRVRDRRDRADDAERRVFDHGQAMVAAEDLAAHELDAGRLFAERLELFDLMHQAADTRLFHFHRAELDRLLDRDTANVADDPLAIFDGAVRKLVKGFGGRGDRLVHAREDAEAAVKAATVRRRWHATIGRQLRRTDAGEYFLNNAANNGFG